MNITETVVKTTYTIEFTAGEFKQIVDSYLHSSKQHHYPRAFEKIEPEHLLKEASPEKVFDELFLNATSDLYNLIAEHFGFDGWYNAGHYRKNRECYCMQVFNYGDTLSPLIGYSGKE